ncbi:hypothetical protein AB1Y20_000087 [Prymnesium parvum]|uniref:S1 motif domain-containing protein n=1 Tax=Prymnesium parvum TaxID=97485 RepID=A0AB34K7H6_PRYPA
MPPPASPPPPPSPPPRKKRSKGSRLSKAEREARRHAREEQASADTQPGARLDERLGELRLRLSHAEWDAACALGVSSPPLAHELCVQLIARGQHRQLTHCARRLAQTVPLESLVPLVSQAIEEGHAAAAAALARGLGVAEQFDLVELALRCYERGRANEAAEVIGGDPSAQLRLLRQMVRAGRGERYATAHLGALRHLPPPDARAFERIGAAVLAAVDAPPPAAAEWVRAAVEAALRRAPAVGRAEVHVFGSAALGIGTRDSDVDLCALLPDHAAASPRSAAGRAALAPLLAAAAEALRGCAWVRRVHLVADARTPLLKLEVSADGGGAAVAVDLCVNNTDGLANTYLMAELARQAPLLRPLLRFVRLWARRRALCGVRGAPNAYAWSLLAVVALQRLECLPRLRADSAAFARLAAAEGSDWRAAAAAAASAEAYDGSLEARMGGAAVASPPASPLAAAARGAAGDDAAVAARTLGQLVWHFFLTWAAEFAYKAQVASLRVAELPKRAKGWSRRDEAALMLEDPVELTRDMARHVTAGAVHALRLDAARALFELHDSPADAGFAFLREGADWRLREHRELLGAERVARLLPPPRGEASLAVPLPLPLPLPLALAASALAVRAAADGMLCVCAEATPLFLAPPAPLAALLAAPSPLKVMHDCRQALPPPPPPRFSSANPRGVAYGRRVARTLLRLHGVRLAGVFDTQAAHAVLRRRVAAASPPPPRGECAPLRSLARKFLDDAHGDEAALLLPLHSRLLLEIDLIAKQEARKEDAPDDEAARDAALRADVMAASDAYLRFAAFEFGLQAAHELRMHAVGRLRATSPPPLFPPQRRHSFLPLQVLPGIVSDITRAGVLVAIGEDILALLPPSELVLLHSPLSVGDELRVRVIGLPAAEGRRPIVSTNLQPINPTLGAAHQLQLGEAVCARVVSVQPDGARLSLELEGKAAELRAADAEAAGGGHIAADLRDVLQVGDLLRARVLCRAETEAQRVRLAAELPAAAAVGGAPVAAPAEAEACGAQPGEKRAWESDSESDDEAKESPVAKRQRA